MEPMSAYKREFGRRWKGQTGGKTGWCLAGRKGGIGKSNTAEEIKTDFFGHSSPILKKKDVRARVLASML